MSEDESQKKKPVKERGIETLRCDLSEAELRERGDVATALIAEIDKAEAEKKEATADFARRIKSDNRTLRKIAAEIRERAVFRDVEVEVRIDYDSGLAETVRLDNGATVRVRPLTPAEKQGELFSPSDPRYRPSWAEPQDGVDA